jgi:HK97 gp10 family phage protein
MAAFPTGVISGFGGRTPRDIVLMSVRGDKEIMKKLKRLERKDAKKVIVRSARAAMRPVMQAAKKGAPVGETGNLRKSIKMRALKRNRRGNIGVRVAISDRWFVGPMFYGAFQEFGWHIGKRDNKLRTSRQWHGIGGEEDTRRFREGEHFMEMAYVNQGHGALKRFLSEVPIQLERAANGG